MDALKRLESDGIAELFWALPTPEAQRSLLAAHPLVSGAREALRQQVVGDRNLVEQIQHWLRDFRTGFRLANEPALTALIVAIENHPSERAGEIVEELATLRVRELSMASRVARLCLEHRRHTLSANKTSLRVIANQPPILSAVKEVTPMRVRIPNADTRTRVQVA